MKALLALLALPEVGLPAIFVVALVGSAFVPIGSEPVLFAYIRHDPEMFWPGVLIATFGSTIGGMLVWWLSYAAKLALGKVTDREARRKARGRVGTRLLKRFRSRIHQIGPPVMVLVALPGFAYPLELVAGWMRMRAVPCFGWMAVGKFLRYWLVTELLLYVPDTVWRPLVDGARTFLHL